MAKQMTGSVRIKTPKKKRKGVNAKSKTSKIKTSKNYKKPYNSQGK
jgi:hypothetical protein